MAMYYMDKSLNEVIENHYFPIGKKCSLDPEVRRQRKSPQPYLPNLSDFSVYSSDRIKLFL